jgi:hypothetical protein
MNENTGIAEVTKVLKQPVFKLAGGLEVAGFTIRAKMYVPAQRYSHDLFYVNVISPERLGGGAH